MKKITFLTFEFAYNPVMDCLFDETKGKIIFFSTNYDEIHLVVEFVSGRLTFHPRWNVNISVDEVNPKKYIIDVNYPNDGLNLSGVPMIK